MSVRPHAAKFFRFDAEERLERTVYEAETAFLTSYQELRDPHTVCSAYSEECEGASCGALVRNIGNRDDNDLVWRNVRIDRSGDRTLVFRCASPFKRHFFVQIDGGEKRKVSVSATRGAFFEASLSVNLTQGLHSIRVSNDSAWAPDFDSMALK